jgi:hypothetical protein
VCFFVTNSIKQINRSILKVPPYIFNKHIMAEIMGIKVNEQAKLYSEKINHKYLKSTANRYYRH